MNVHAAPGTANALGAMYNAAMDRSPMVVLAGQQTQRLLAQGPALGADTVTMTRPITRWSWELTNPDELPSVVHRAFATARRPPRGPVFVSFPKDVLDRDLEFDPAGYGPSADRPVCVAPAAVAEAAALLARAQRPAIVAGRALARDDAWVPLAAIAERLGAPIHASPVGFPAAHPQVCSLLGWDPRPLRQALAAADVVLVRRPPPVAERSGGAAARPGRGADPRRRRAGRRRQDYRSTVALLGDLRGSLDALLAALEDALPADAAEAAARRLETEAAARGRREQMAARQRERWGQVPIAPSRVAAALDAVLPDDAIVVDEGIRASDYVKWHYRGAVPGRYHSYDGGCLGWGIGMGVGVQLARPAQQVVTVVGDGGAVFGIHALWTAARRGCRWSPSSWTTAPTAPSSPTSWTTPIALSPRRPTPAAIWRASTSRSRQRLRRAGAQRGPARRPGRRPALGARPRAARRSSTSSPTPATSAPVTPAAPPNAAGRPGKCGAVGDARRVGRRSPQAAPGCIFWHHNPRTGACPTVTRGPVL